MQVRRVDWIQTPGEIAALLKESALVKELLPSHNTRLRRNKELCAWRIPDLASGQPELVWGRDLNLGAQPDLYGIFRSQRDAMEMLSEIAQSEKLCKAVLGLEKVKPDNPCFGFQLKQCKGACVGKEKSELHQARLLMALARHRVPAWPYQGPVGLKEDRALHVIDAWCYLGTASSDEEVIDLLTEGKPVFDLDVYKILRKALKTLPIVPFPLDRSLCS